MKQRKYLTKSSILVVILILVGCVSIGAQQTKLSAAERGRSDAARDVKHKKLVIKAWGLAIVSVGGIPSKTDVYESILHMRYKISYEWVAGCVIDPETLSYADAYNQVSKAGIEARFGKGILEKVRKEADKEYEAKDTARGCESSIKSSETLSKACRRKIIEVARCYPAVTASRVEKTWSWQLQNSQSFVFWLSVYLTLLSRVSGRSSSSTCTPKAKSAVSSTPCFISRWAF